MVKTAGSVLRHLFALPRDLSAIGQWWPFVLNALSFLLGPAAGAIVEQNPYPWEWNRATQFGAVGLGLFVLAVIAVWRLDGRLRQYEEPMSELRDRLRSRRVRTHDEAVGSASLLDVFMWIGERWTYRPPYVTVASELKFRGMDFGAAPGRLQSQVIQPLATLGLIKPTTGAGQKD